MNILFLHNSFPGQFGPRAQFLQDRGHKVIFLTAHSGVEHMGFEVRSFKTRPIAGDLSDYSRSFNEAVARAHSVAASMMALKQENFTPDVVISHVGNGLGFFTKDVWSTTRHLAYLEWYYRVPGADIEFLYGDTPRSRRDLVNRLQNAASLLEAAGADRHIVPTQWQKQQFPDFLQDSIEVLHDGLEVERTTFSIEKLRTVLERRNIPTNATYITYLARGFERYRGFSEFMASLKILQARHPDLHAIVTGLDRVFYGRRNADGRTFKQAALDDLELDLDRIHFPGWLDRGEYKLVLQGAAAHVYLTVPFVLSWSLLEAMSLGCGIVASRVSPVEEFMTDRREGLLADFFNADDIASKVSELISNPSLRFSLGRNASQRMKQAQNRARLFREFETLLKGMAGFPQAP